MSRASREKRADPPTGRRIPVSVVLLDDERIVQLIFNKLGAANSHEELSRKVFRQIAKSMNLQSLMLNVL
jgi:hypothetical protein